MNNILKAIKRNTVLKIFALVIAILLWFYVKIVQNPEIAYDTFEIPITITGEAAINSEGFIISSMPKSMKTYVTISTRQTKIKNIDASVLEATLDVSNVTDSGDKSFSISVRSNDYEVNIISKTPSALSFTIDKLITDMRPIKLSYNGTLDASLYIDKDNVIITPENATIKIPAALADKISDVLVDIDMTDVKNSIEGSYNGKLIDAKNEEVQSSYATIVSEDINVLVPILKKKTVPISLISTPPDVHFDLSAVQVELAGDEGIIDKLDYIEGSIENYSDTEKTYIVNLKLGDFVLVDKQEITATVVSIGPETANTAN